MKILSKEQQAKIIEVISLLMDGDSEPETLQGKALVAIAAYQEFQEEQTIWLSQQDWDNAEQFHGEDSNGNCALCHGDTEQCAYCKANS